VCGKKNENIDSISKHFSRILVTFLRGNGNILVCIKILKLCLQWIFPWISQVGFTKKQCKSLELIKTTRQGLGGRNSKSYIIDYGLVFSIEELMWLSESYWNVFIWSIYLPSLRFPNMVTLY
jgi:hypothetical protein